MYNGILSIDHPVVAVADMNSAKTTYEKLGFTVPPRGSHVQWGTGNWCIMFADDYLELRGILDPERFTLNLPLVLTTYGEGLMGVAFGTEGAEVSCQKLQDNGIAVGPLKSLTRNFELPEGWTQPQFKLCFPEERHIYGLMHVVLCEHLTPALIRKPEYLCHANSVTGISAMIGVVADLDAAAEAMVKLLGQGAVTRSEQMLRLITPSGQQIQLLSHQSYQAQFADIGKDLQAHDVCLGAIELKVADINQSKACLSKNAVPFQPWQGDAIIVPAEYGAGVSYIFRHG